MRDFSFFPFRLVCVFLFHSVDNLRQVGEWRTVLGNLHSLEWCTRCSYFVSLNALQNSWEDGWIRRTKEGNSKIFQIVEFLFMMQWIYIKNCECFWQMIDKTDKTDMVEFYFSYFLHAWTCLVDNIWNQTFLSSVVFHNFL